MKMVSKPPSTLSLNNISQSIYKCQLALHTSHVKWVHCMARPQVADGGDGLQIWRVAANILNKQSRTIDKG
jgi:hypothetical protein